ncbi:M3 family metallopeptidase [Rapidithrix thailandica]|uniref:M3 family metallopeptidase n=1 Tax=Rapidithrix thailandica TaxID=413964 RepID=A0AAW9S5Y9_9BACT
MNTLLEEFKTPLGTIPFDRLSNKDYLPAITSAIANAKKTVDEIVNNPETPSFENTIVALERSDEQVNLVSNVFFNLNSAETNEEMQEIAKEISPMLSEYSNDILLNEVLFHRIKTVWQQREQFQLDTESFTLLEKTYKSFTRNGANLSVEDKAQLREIDKEKSKLSLEFGEHVLKETNEYFLEITDEKDLEGLPEGIVEAAKIAAQERKKENSWVFTLDAPSYIPFMTYLKNRSLRKELFKVFGSRAAKGDQNDNQAIVKKIVQLRHQRSQLLGYATHAHFVLEERMAQSPEKVGEFLSQLLEYAKPAAQKDLEEVSAYAQQLDGLNELQRWDFAYYSEKLKKEKYQIDDEILKPYFQLENVIEGVFQVASKLYGLKFKTREDIPVYHKDVTAYEVSDDNGKYIGVFYADFFPRKGKRNGAWMTLYKGQKKVNAEDKRPHISIVCNFTKPTATKPSLLTFNEVLTLFHEFGHALHGLLADGTYESLSGTNVYWDFVELPSQVLENWVYEKECLDLFARHYQTGEKIPETLVERIKESATFLEGYQTLRQLSFGMLDMAYHTQNPENIENVIDFELETLKETELFPKVEGSNVSCAFSHIFHGGYSSGYYSYKWAEVLDADAFEYFTEKGIFNREVADKFKKYVLSAGGREHPMELYKKFRGKEPSIQALLKRSGLVKA